MISKISLENFKAFKSLDLNFSNLNVFAGINGIGKSSVIQSLLLLRQSYSPLNPTGPEGIYLKGDIIDLGTAKDVLFGEADKDLITLNIDFENGFLNCKCRYQPDLNILEFDEQSFKNFETQSLFTSNFQYLSAQRTEPSIKYPMDTYQVERLKSLGKYGEYTAHFIALNKRKEIHLQELLLKSGKSKHLLNQIVAWLNRISPGISLDSDLFPELNLAKIVFSFSREDGYSANYSPVNVGFGYSYVLPVITAILAADDSSLIIVENPESHLHPHGQAVLGSLLAKAAQAGIQLFIETHSDHLINGIRVALKENVVDKDKVKVVFFDREENDSFTECYYPIIDQEGRISNLPKGFLDEYSNQLDKLLQ